jgi:uncharacterized protein
MKGVLKIVLGRHTMMLLPQKAMYWETHSALLLADLHLGKAGHFRKAGVPIPGSIHQSDLLTLNVLLSETGADKVFILGDLFHSEHNAEWEMFREWLDARPKLSCTLIAGNHDILHPHHYTIPNLSFVPDHYVIDDIVLSHEPVNPKIANSTTYNLCGHIHPGLYLKAGAKQGMRLPCFYFGPKFGVLPAFGKFTGLGKLNFSKEDRIFAIADEKVIEIPFPLIKN